MAVLFRIDGVSEARGFLRTAADRMRRPERELKLAGEEMLARTQRRMRAGLDVEGKPFVRSKRSERAGGQTLWDRGALAASASYATTRDVLELFSSDKRALVHYEGATITPKRAKFLTIPLRARGGMFAGGVVAQDNRRGDRARHYKGTFFLRRGGRLFLMQRLPGEGRGRIRALFILLKKVQLPARRWLGFGRADVEMVAERLGRSVTGDES